MEASIGLSKITPLCLPRVIVRSRLIETAKARYLEPTRYLLFLFKHLGRARSPSDYRALLPQLADGAQLQRPARIH